MLLVLCANNAAIRTPSDDLDLAVSGRLRLRPRITASRRCASRRRLIANSSAADPVAVSHDLLRIFLMASDSDSSRMPASAICNASSECNVFVKSAPVEVRSDSFGR
jgi:hypothetical protein